MDPLTAIANLIAALANLVAKVAEGQTPEQRKILWDWFIKDVAFWRKLFKLDGDAPI